ncbi:unnamed protein product [Pedinophyceae sp. YPF-701]|nr:unnamed protein product [Pedinophyceae sp. YPF-701]
MPVVGVPRDELFARLGRTYTQEEFEELCFEYGVELDDVTSEQQMQRKEFGDKDAGIGEDEEIIYRIDIPANRYDMLCTEGIARALNVFLGRQAAPTYTVAPAGPDPELRMVVRPEVAMVRPFVVCAVLRGVKFDKVRYNSFIDLQDKLHQNLCRQRSLVAIGTHDLDKVRGPFTYEALPPEQIRFTPLKQEREFGARELLAHYEEHDQKLRKYVPIIKDSLVYPVILDADRTVLSLPPIINGARSAISLDTTNVFVECTATDLHKARMVLNTVCCMFSEYCARPYEVEPVEVVDPFGSAAATPDLASHAFNVSTQGITSLVGVGLPGTEIAALLQKMQLRCTPAGPDRVRVEVPPTRTDILHEVDIAEDVAIAYGYNNVAVSTPGVVTVGRELPVNHLTELLRAEVAMAGYTEILTWALCSRQENFAALRKADDGATAVEIGNPATAEFEVVRTALLPAALKTLGANTDAPLPIKLFEVSDVVTLTDALPVGAQNRRHVVAVFCGREAGFEAIHGLLNRIFDVLGVPHESMGAGPAKGGNPVAGRYGWKEAPGSLADKPGPFFPGRHATVHFNGRDMGEFGVIHPETLAAFDITVPVSALELDLEVLSES